MIHRVPIGQLLLESNGLSHEHLEAALARQRADGGRLCSVALESGFVDERTLVRTLSRQLGVPAMVVTEVRPEASGAAVVSREVATRFCVLPARVFNRTLTLLMRDPTDAAGLDELQAITGKAIRPLVAIEAPLKAAIRRFYDEHAGVASATTPVPEHPPEEDSGADGALDGDPRPRILCVDDDPSILRLYEGIFGSTTYRVFTCPDGAAAVETARAVRPQLILLDARLPGLHGFEVCRRIKDDPELAAIPVILSSGAYRGWQMRADLMRHCQADDVIEKPFNLDHLTGRVAELLRQTRSDRQTTGGTRALAADAVKFLNAGLLLLQQGELDAAATEFRRSIERQPFSARPHFYLGKIHERRNERYEAMYAYEQAIALEATFFPAMNDLALLYEEAGFVQKAVELWHQAMAVCPDAVTRQTIKDHLVGLL